jgi:hypothetical protein
MSQSRPGKALRVKLGTRKEAEKCESKADGGDDVTNGPAELSLYIHDPSTGNLQEKTQ